MSEQQFQIYSILQTVIFAWQTKYVKDRQISFDETYPFNLIVFQIFYYYNAYKNVWISFTKSSFLSFVFPNLISKFNLRLESGSVRGQHDGKKLCCNVMPHFSINGFQALFPGLNGILTETPETRRLNG